MPMEFIVPTLRVDALMNLTQEKEAQKKLEDLMDLEEDGFIPGSHQNVQKVQQKS